MINIVLADRGSLFVDLLADVLSRQGYVVTGTATTPDEVRSAMCEARPDLCLIDHAALGGTRALPLLEELRTAGEDRTRIVAVTDQLEPSAPDQALAHGAVGYVHKGCAMRTFLEALARVAREEVVVEAGSPERPRRSRPVDHAHRLAATLTPREWECLALLVDGASTVDMASTLGVSVMTVRSHVRSLLAKLAVHSRLEAASLAMRHDLLGARVA